MPTLTTATQRLKDTSLGIMWPRKTLLSLMSKSVNTFINAEYGSRIEIKAR